MRCYSGEMTRAVIDTNVLVAGLSRRGSEGAVLDAWVDGRFQPCVPTALALEYEDLLTRKLGRERQDTIPGALQALLSRSEYVPIHFTYRPASPDPADDLVVDCVLNSGALLVTANVRDFRKPAEELGFPVYGPLQFLGLLEQEETP